MAESLSVGSLQHEPRPCSLGPAGTVSHPGATGQTAMAGSFSHFRLPASPPLPLPPHTNSKFLHVQAELTMNLLLVLRITLCQHVALSSLS